MAKSLSKLLNLLKSVADSTRLRMLAVLAQGELTVGEIALVLEQSQPRISRHLKLLGAAGLLERIKEDHSVYYRLASGGTDLDLPALLDLQDPVLAGDRQRREAVIAERVRRATDRLAESTSGVDDEFAPTVGTLVREELQVEPVGALLDVGTGAGYLLKTLAPLAVRAVGVDISSDALRLARSQLQGRSFEHCFVRRGDMYRLPFGEREFDTVTLGRVLSQARDPQAVLAEAARVIKAGGRLLLVEDFDELENAVGGNPLARIKSWLAGVGLRCERLRPLDTGSSHLLFTVARHPVAVMEAA